MQRFVHITRLLLTACLMLWGGVALAGPRFEAGKTAHYDFEWTPGVGGFAKALMARAEGDHLRIYEELGSESKGRTTVTLLASRQDMLEAAGRRYGHPPPEWAGGLAFPSKRHIFLNVDDGPDALAVTFQHEMSHVALGEIAGPPEVPLWFVEGIAVRQSEGWSMDRVHLLTEAATVGALLDLDDMERRFPDGRARAGLAYAQAVHFIGFLQGELGAEGFHALLVRLRAGEPLKGALEALHPGGLKVLERRWRDDLEVYWGWVPMVFGSTSIWVLTVGLLLWAWRRRRRRREARLTRLRAAEAAYDAGELKLRRRGRRVFGGLARRGAQPDAEHDPYPERPPTLH